MGSFLAIVPVVIRRTRANGRLLAAVVVGAVLATALMSTTAIYTDAIRDLGLAHALRTAGPNSLNLLTESSSQSPERVNYDKNQEFVDATVRRYLGASIKGDPSDFGRSATFFPTAPGDPVAAADNRPRSQLQFVDGLEQQTHIVEGRLPNPTSGSATAAPTIEVALGAATAARLNVKVGDRFDLHPFWALEREPVHVVVTGLIEPIDLKDPFWRGQTDIFDIQNRGWETLPFFIPRDTFFDAIGVYLPTMSSDYARVYYLDTGAINARNATAYGQRIDQMKSQIGSNLPRVQVQTELSNVLSTFDEKLFFTRIPLLVLVLQIAGIVLYYLYMVSTMLIERQTREIALLKSRGATTAQVMQIYAVEGFFIFCIALITGPPLAALVISLLGQTPAFADLSGGGYLSVRLSTAAYLWALLGAGLAYATLLWPAYQATKATVVQQRGSMARPPKQPVFTRYYLDLVLVGLGAFMFFELQRRGSVVTEKVFGEQTVDPILLLTPAVFIITVAVVFLRLFPVVLRVLAWVVSRAQGVAVLIGMWHMVRNPVHYSRLILLLMLATAVGMFSASFGTTLNHSYADRAAYESGADLRLDSIRKVDASGPGTMSADLTKSLDASAVSPVARLNGSMGTAFQLTRFDVLALEPQTFNDVAYLRGDFASAGLEREIEGLQPEREQTVYSIVAGTRVIGMWVSPVALTGRVAFDVQVVDATGRWGTVTLGPAGGVDLAPGWTFLAADVSTVQPRTGSVLFNPGPLQFPLTVKSISLRFIARAAAQAGSVQFGDLVGSSDPGAAARLSADLRMTSPEPVEALINAQQIAAIYQGWEAMKGLGPQPMTDELRDVGTGIAQLTWKPTQGSPNRGIAPAGTFDVVPVLASEAFLEQGRVAVGDRAFISVGSGYMDIEIVGSFSLFPTMADPRKAPTLIADIDRVLDLQNVLPRAASTYADQAWVRNGPDTQSLADKAVAEQTLQAKLVSLQGIRAEQQTDPLVAAGWEGILFISFAAILLLSGLGFLIYSYLTAQRRSLEFAVLRTMGFSRRQIATVVGFEQVFIIGLGMIAGTAMGLRLGSLMIRYMGLTETGDQAIPPMALHVSWLTIGTAWLTLGVAFLVTIGIVVLLYSRLALSRVLRIGES